jgi:hypothetical protein
LQKRPKEALPDPGSIARSLESSDLHISASIKCDMMYLILDDLLRVELVLALRIHNPGEGNNELTSFD